MQRVFKNAYNGSLSIKGRIAVLIEQERQRVV
jgi:hypothetical protein